MAKAGTQALLAAEEILASRLKEVEGEPGVGAFKAWLLGELAQAQCQDLQAAASLLDARMRMVALIAADLRAQAYAQSARPGA
jgi:hypothetical protein